MIVDLIVKASAFLMLSCPLLLPAAILATLVTVLVTRQPKTSLSLAFPLSIGIGFLGVFFVEPIKSGGWNWQFIGLPFLFCKWILIGFSATWPLLAYRQHVPRALLALQVFLASLFFILITITIANHTYVPAVARADTQFWEHVLEMNDAKLPARDYKRHLSSFGREAVLHHLHYHKDTAPEMLHVLADILPEGVGAIADQGSIDRELAEKVLHQAGSARWVLLPQLARNPGVPADILLRLSDDPDVVVRRELSLNVAAPPEILVKLITAGEHWLAQQQRAPERNRNSWAISTTLETVRNAKANLANRLDPAAGRNVREFSLMHLAKDTDVSVRRSVARNPHAPTDLLLQLTRDTDGEVATRAFESLGRSPNTPLNLLQELARNSGRNHRIQTAVASNPKTPLSILAVLVRVREYETRMAAIRTLATGDSQAHDLLRTWLREADGFDLRSLSTEKGLPEWVHVEIAQLKH